MNLNDVGTQASLTCCQQSPGLFIVCSVRDVQCLPKLVFGVDVSCRNFYSFVVYLYVNGSGSITSVGEERANLSAVVYL